MVRVGTEGTYPPFSYHDPRTQQLAGYDIEVIKAIAEQAGWKLDFVETQWDAIFPALDAKRIDVIANQVSVNDEREAKYGLSDTYTYSHGVIVRRKGDDSIKTLADLKGKTTAQSSTSNWAQVARDAGAKVEAVEGFAQAAALLAQGRVDAIVNDNIAVLDYLASTGSDGRRDRRERRRGDQRAGPRLPQEPTPTCSTRRTRRSPRSRTTGRCATSRRSTSRPTSRWPTAARPTCPRAAAPAARGRCSAARRGRCSSAWSR